MANLAAAFVRPQASPIIAVGGAFIDRTPPALKNFAVEKFGENDKNMLLLGMYVTIALIAVVIGMIAWRHIAVGVGGIGLFGAFGAFVAYTRPESQVTDVIPALIGGVGGHRRDHRLEPLDAGPHDDAAGSRCARTENCPDGPLVVLDGLHDRHGNPARPPGAGGAAPGEPAQVPASPAARPQRLPRRPGSAASTCRTSDSA